MSDQIRTFDDTPLAARLTAADRAIAGDVVSLLNHAPAFELQKQRQDGFHFVTHQWQQTDEDGYVFAVQGVTAVSPDRTEIMPHFSLITSGTLNRLKIFHTYYFSPRASLIQEIQSDRDAGWTPVIRLSETGDTLVLTGDTDMLPYYFMGEIRDHQGMQSSLWTAMHTMRISVNGNRSLRPDLSALLKRLQPAPA